MIKLGWIAVRKRERTCEFAQSASAFNLNLLSLTSASCVNSNINYYHEFIGMALLPVVSLMFVYAAYWNKRRKLKNELR